MKIIINREFCQKIWKTHISHVKEPTRTRKMRELCYKMMHENDKKVNLRNRGKVQNGIRDFLKSYEETEIEFNEEADGKFFKI